jgi:uncharacterized membrane protein
VRVADNYGYTAGLLLLTLFDVLMVWLTWREYTIATIRE